MSTGRLAPMRFALAYLATAAALLALDGIWLGVLTADLYRREMGPLMAETVRVAPAVAFYLLYPLALVYLALHREPSGRAEAVTRSVVLGLAAYGAYDLTNLAVVRGWPLGLSLLDWAWGGVVTGLAGAAGHAAGWRPAAPASGPVAAAGSRRAS
jgi:uncharacterized membrane protein